MPRSISRKWQSNRSVSEIDQRLAAASHQEQIENILRCETIADKVEQGYSRVAKSIVDVARSSEAIGSKLDKMRSVMSEVDAWAKETIRKGFSAIAHDTHRSLSRSYSRIIPIPWTLATISPEAKAAFEAVRYPPPFDPVLRFDPSAGMLTIAVAEDDSVSNPIDIPLELFKSELTDEDKRELVEKLVFPAPSQRDVAEIVARSNSNTGDNWEDRFDRLSGKITERRAVFSQLVTGFADGETIDQLATRIRPLTSGIASSARRIARTEGLRVAERMQRRSWDNLGTLFRGAQVIAVLDQNTRSHHASRNGTIYSTEPMKNQKPISELPDLPDEANCRCWSTPVLRPPREIERDPLLSAQFKTDQGSGIPDPTSYASWFDQADVTRRQLAVGRKRYEVVRKQYAQIREPEWTDFIDDDGKLVPTATLQSESITKRQARKTRITKMLADRERARREISQKQFVAPRIEPTRVPGISFSGSIDLTDPVSVLGEHIRSKVAEGAKSESELRTIGKVVRSYVDTPETRMLSSDLSRLQREMDKLRKLPSGAKADEKLKNSTEQQRIQRQIGTVRRERYQRLMANVRDMGHNRPHPTTASSDPDAVRMIVESQRFFPRDWNQRMFDDGPIDVSFGKGYYDARRRRLTISHSVGGNRSTAVHELMHRVESVTPELLEAERSLYNRRTKGNKLRPISFQSGQTRRNSWGGHKADGLAEYMGRDYEGDAFEVSTMSMESLIYGTYGVDDDAFELLLGSLAAL